MSKQPAPAPLQGTPPSSDDSAAPRLERRSLLKLGLGAAATLAGTAARAEPGPAAPLVPGAEKLCGMPLPVLSTSGKLLDPVTGREVEKDPDYHSGGGHAAVREGIPNRKWVMVIDLSACDGCEKCTASCSKAHHTPPDRQWIKVFKIQNVPGKTLHWFPKPCFHCDDPPCTRVCPVDATFKRQDGIVLIDNERCIGCRFCMAACPYSTRSFNWGPPPEAKGAPAYTPERSVPRRIGTVEKCDFCPEMLRQGKQPHCVSNCTMGALMFGDRNEDAVTDAKGKTYRLSTLLQEKGGYRYLEELGTKPSVYYLPPKNPKYDAPKRERSEG